MARTGITLTYQPAGYRSTRHGQISRCAGWVARCEGFCGWSPSRNAAYRRAYRHVQEQRMIALYCTPYDMEVLFQQWEKDRGET